MNSNSSANSSDGPHDAEQARWLAAYDDALSSGARPAAPAGESAVPPDLAENVDLLHLLDRLRPRQRPRAPGAAADAGSPAPEGRYVLRVRRAVGGVGEIWLARDAE